MILIWHSCLLKKQTWQKPIRKWGRNTGCPGLRVGVSEFKDLWESQGRSDMANCSTTHHHYLGPCSVAGWGSRRSLWKMELRRLHLARGAMPRETLTGGNTRVHWHFSTTWSMRPIKAHRRTHTDLDPPTPSQLHNFIWLQSHHEVANAGLHSSLKKSIFIGLKCKGSIWGSSRRLVRVVLHPRAFILSLFTRDSPNGHYSPPILDHSECSKPPHVVFIKLHVHPSFPESLISSCVGRCFHSSLWAFFLFIAKDRSHSSVCREESEPVLVDVL